MKEEYSLILLQESFDKVNKVFDIPQIGHTVSTQQVSYKLLVFSISPILYWIHLRWNLRLLQKLMELNPPTQNQQKK